MWDGKDKSVHEFVRELVCKIEGESVQVDENKKKASYNINVYIISMLILRFLYYLFNMYSYCDLFAIILSFLTSINFNCPTENNIQYLHLASSIYYICTSCSKVYFIWTLSYYIIKFYTILL